MTPALYVAAGGGGDAIAATLLTTHETGDAKPYVATFAWDRLLIDPLPGPRSLDDFDGLTWHAPTVAEITPATTPRAPSGSTLPRLADEIHARLFLLDPHLGAVGIAQQLNATAAHLGCSHLVLVDVGGDIIGRGNELGLRSPLADSLALIACALTELPCRVVITGAGLDGELTEAEVIKRCHEHGAQQSGHISAQDAAAFRPLLNWHPSEVTGLLLAAATGYRGVVEVRDTGLPVPLTDASTHLYELPITSLTDANLFADGLAPSTSLAEVEDAISAVCGNTEIDYERCKAQRLTPPNQYQKPTRSMLDEISTKAKVRGADYLTTRRIAELLRIRGDHLEDLSNDLRSITTARYDPPLWSVTG